MQGEATVSGASVSRVGEAREVPGHGDDGAAGDVQQRGGEEEREAVASPTLQRRGSARLGGAFGEEDGDARSGEESRRTETTASGDGAMSGLAAPRGGGETKGGPAWWLRRGEACGWRHSVGRGSGDGVTGSGPILIQIGSKRGEGRDEGVGVLVG